MDSFPALGPTINRATGANKTMRTVADYREREARRIATEPSQPARAAASD